MKKILALSTLLLIGCFTDDDNSSSDLDIQIGGVKVLEHIVDNGISKSLRYSQELTINSIDTINNQMVLKVPGFDCRTAEISKYNDEPLHKWVEFSLDTIDYELGESMLKFNGEYYLGGKSLFDTWLMMMDSPTTRSEKLTISLTKKTSIIDNTYECFSKFKNVDENTSAVDCETLEVNLKNGKKFSYKQYVGANLEQVFKISYGDRQCERIFIAPYNKENCEALDRESVEQKACDDLYDLLKTENNGKTRVCSFYELNDGNCDNDCINFEDTEDCAK